MILSIVLGFTLALAGGGDAFAARLGGGKSFGSRPAYSQAYRSSPGMGQPGMRQPGAAAQQPAYSAAAQRNQAMRDSFRQRGGLMGMLGGLALGGLLGALLFGGGFEGLNFLDLLLFAGVAFLLFKLFAARRRAQEGTAVPAGHYAGDPDPGFRPYERQADNAPESRAGFNTDLLFGKGRPASVNPTAGFADTPKAEPLPADFDAAAFLSGAKAAYRMMQEAWDRGDLAEIRSLTTDKVFGELQDQIRARGNTPNRTEILTIEAEVLEVRDFGADREATVLFDVILRESPEAQPGQVREVWHFVRARNSRQPTWFLDGIQQLED